VQQALSRISARSDESRQALARVNSVTSKLGDRVDQGSPLLTELVNATRDELGPKIAETRAQAAVLRDGVMSVNAALETLDTLGFITGPTLDEALSTVSERVEAAQSDLQELRVAIDEARTTASANLVAAVTSRTTKIDNGLAQIKSAAIKFQVAVEQKQQQVADLSRTVLLATNLLAISLTALFLAGAAGQVVLISVCWQYVRSGRFTLVRVA
jgi:chromosome segregation ATPase